jgi:hypothetical protein
MTEIIGRKNCIRCKVDIDSDAIYCNECGATQAPEPLTGGHCPGCGDTVAVTDKFCRSCALNLNAPNGEPIRLPFGISVPLVSSDSALSAEHGRQLSSQSVPGDGESGFNRLRGVEAGPLNHTDHQRVNYATYKSPSAVMDRYRDGYLVAKTLDGFGRTLKILGAIIGGGIMFFGFVIGSSLAGAASSMGSVGTGAGSFFFFLFSFGIWGAVIGGIFWVMGTLVSAQGQVLKAQLDGAVYASPFMSDADKARVMSLPPDVARS